MNEVVESELALAGDGGTLPALLYRPDGPGPHPAVVLGMEATGLNRFIRGLGAELARRGYVAVVPDYYRGGGPDDPEDLDDIEGIMAHVGTLDFVRATRDIHTAIDHACTLDTVDPRQVAVWGYCTGATMTMLAASTRRDLTAAVCFYPSQPWFETLDAAHPVHPVDLLWGVACPLLLLYGDQDVVMPAEQLAGVRERLSDWRVDHEVRVFPGAGHAFMAEHAAFHHAQASVDGAAAALAFVERHLPPGPAGR